ncbi:MAG: hypothetical protein H6Q79_2539, partial [Deltaproteobacteria bacterium]|nr:hypothetical protein [Deltaproteobacteria bacterium]
HVKRLLKIILLNDKLKNMVQEKMEFLFLVF